MSLKALKKTRASAELLDFINATTWSGLPVACTRPTCTYCMLSWQDQIRDVKGTYRYRKGDSLRVGEAAYALVCFAFV
jgi:hypothetical protein